MKNNSLLKIIILFFIIIFFCLLCFSFFLLNNIKNENNRKAIINDERPQNVEEAIIASGSEYIKEDENKIYVKFINDLYDEKENSNEIYFNKLIDELKRFYEKKDFYLIDNSKDIEIYAKYEDESYVIIINGIEDYFEKVDGKIYSDINKIELPQRQVIYTYNDFLNGLAAGQMSIKYISKMLGEGEELENGYISYLDGAILLKTTTSKTVRNIIFTYKYDNEVVKGVKVKTNLREILNLYPDKVFGSLEDKYLGYYTDDFYYFFYEDEISVYAITYNENDKFEEFLTNYLEDKDLDKFVNSIQSTIRNYDYLEYDPDIKKAHIMFSHKGYEIDIEENDPKGIILYSNYYFSNITKDYAQRGLITLKSKENSVEKIEKERRLNR